MNIKHQCGFWLINYDLKRIPLQHSVRSAQNWKQKQNNYCSIVLLGSELQCTSVLHTSKPIRARRTKPNDTRCAILVMQYQLGREDFSSTELCLMGVSKGPIYRVSINSTHFLKDNQVGVLPSVGNRIKGIVELNQEGPTRQKL